MNSIYKYLTPYKHNSSVLVKDQNVADIITGMLQAHKIYAKEYDKIAPAFKGRTDLETGRKIYNFLKNNVKYVVEPDEKQTLKSPSAILYTGNTTGSDCKNYSLFTGGILSALNRRGAKINWAYRYASYRMFDKMPHHVFVVINPDTANEIWIDAVLPKYNLKKQYNYKTDKKVNDMALISLSGIGAPKKRATKKPAKKTATKKTATQKKELRKGKATKLKATIKKTGKTTLKFVATPSRNAFLALVKLNFMGLATKLNRAIQTNPDKLRSLWESVGGSYKTLTIAVGQGFKKKRIGDANRMLGVSVGSIEAIVATATPILLKVSNFLKSVGIEPENLLNVAKEKVQEIAEAKIEQINEQAQAEKEIAQQDVAQVDKAIKQADSTTSSTAEAETDGGSTGAGMNKNTLILVGAGAVALYLFTRKR
jgi:hypothetical protein